MALTRSLSNSAKKKNKMQVVIQDKIEAYLERKFRLSRSFATRESYRITLHRFVDFIQTNYNMDYSQFMTNLTELKKDPIDVLNEILTDSNVQTLSIPK